VRSLESARLLTLTGPGGSGKTRLAIEAASSSLALYPDGVWFVDLSSLTDPGLVAPALATVLGLREQADLSLTSSLVSWLTGRDVLLILDNCEHLIRSCASLIDTLLRECPHLSVLATSRQVLNISGETLWRIPSLSFPDPHHPSQPEELRNYEAIQLFIERARLKEPTFDLTSETAQVVAQICYSLDGLPLAIELAAARVGTMSVTEIATRLDERFRLLAGDDQTAPSRQQTLRAAIDWSYDHLGKAEQRLLRSLSVFVGNFSLQAVEAICMGGPPGSAGATDYDEYDALDLLSELVDKSLLIAEPWKGETRYRLLDTIRQYASLKLSAATGRSESEGGTESLRKRHLLWYLQLAEEAQTFLQGPDQATWLDRLQVENDNMRMALQYGQEVGDGFADGSRLAVALGAFWYLRGYASEGRRWLESAIKSNTLPPELMAKALNRAGLLARSQGDYSSAATLFMECLALYRRLGDKKQISAALINLGVVATNTGQYEEATTVLTEALSLKQEIGDKSGIATALNNLANIAADQGNFKEAGQYYEQCAVMQRAVGNKFMLSISLNNLGNVARCMGEYRRARELVTESLNIKRELEETIEIASSFHKLAEIEWCEHNYAEARRLCEEGLAVLSDTGDTEATALLLNTLGEIARASGDYAEAQSRYEQALLTTRERWIINDAVFNLGRIALYTADYQQAQVRLAECLGSYVQASSKRGIAECIATIARSAVTQNLPERAAKLFGYVDALLEATGYRMHPNDERDLAQARAAVQVQLGKAGWTLSWDEGRSLSAESAMAIGIETLQTVSEAAANGTSKKAKKRSKQYPRGLTQREVEVLRLVTEGLTDAQVAERLYLSTNTVHAHLRSIYDKLAVSTRSSAARFAVENSLN
jgi:predicted ATPase/DNA-binding CsgD family transcriptional regulator/Tfp pilus assembly protein PilF